MLWENLTVPQFAAAVKKTKGVCLLPIGVIEAHARHLPLGTDALACFEFAKRAADIEPAVVLPKNFWGVNHESYHRSGGIVIRREILFALLENLCDECSRNGFKKIILVSGHGGNRFFVNLFVQLQVERDVDYVVYSYSQPKSEEMRKIQEKLIEEKETGHACEWETSRALYMYPELVDMKCLSKSPFRNRKRNEKLLAVGLYSPVDWHAMYPTMQVGHAKAATAEKGRIFVEGSVKALAKAIKAVKDDTITPKLLRDFLKMKHTPTSGWKEEPE